MASHVSQFMENAYACGTHGKPCVIHGMPCVNMHGTFESYKYGVPIQFVGSSKKKEEEGKREREERKRKMEERKGEREEKKREGKKKREEEKGGREEMEGVSHSEQT